MRGMGILMMMVEEKKVVLEVDVVTMMRESVKAEEEGALQAQDEAVVGSSVATLCVCNNL